MCIGILIGMKSEVVVSAKNNNGIAHAKNSTSNNYTDDDSL